MWGLLASLLSCSQLTVQQQTCPGGAEEHLVSIQRRPNTHVNRRHLMSSRGRPGGKEKLQLGFQ